MMRINLFKNNGTIYKMSYTLLYFKSVKDYKVLNKDMQVTFKKFE